MREKQRCAAAPVERSRHAKAGALRFSYGRRMNVKSGCGGFCGGATRS